MATGARIEAYSYSDGTAQWESTHSLAVNLAGVAKVRHNSPMRLEDQLAAWQTALDAAKPAGAPWALSYSSTTRRVTVASAGPIFSLVFPGNVGPWLGFTQGTLTGAATYTGDAAPAGLVQCAGVTAPLPEMVERSQTTAIRHGRAYSYAWGRVDLWRLEILIDRLAYPWQAQQSLDAADPAAGWATAGRVRVYQSSGSSAAYSETRPTGYIDGYVSACDAQVIGTGERWLQLRMDVVAPYAATGLAEPTGLWGAVRYGWSPIYWLTVAGIPTVWTERVTGLTLPAGWVAESATLDIDQSAAVGSTIDRSRGLGTGLPLTFQLRDSAAIGAYMARPTLKDYLKQSLTASGMAITSANSTPFPASGQLHLGLELISYSAEVGTGFTLSARGVAGSLACAHTVGKIGQVITDTPTQWVGRDVRLYALACDPAGVPTGTLLADDSEEVWRGRLSKQAARQVGAWQFTADALDRVLDRKLAGKVTGRVVSYGTAIKVKPTFRISITLDGFKNNYTAEWPSAYTITIYPFASYSPGDIVSRSQAIAAIQTAWAAEVTAQGCGAYIDTTLQIADWQGVDGATLTSIAPLIKAHVNLYFVSIGNNYYGSLTKAVAGYENGSVVVAVDAQTVDKTLFVGWTVGTDPQALADGVAQPPVTSAIAVQIDEGAFDQIDTTGYLHIATEITSKIVKYGGKTEVDGLVYFSLIPTPGQMLSKAELDAATVSVWASIGPGSLESLMLTAIQSSGAGSQGTYDLSKQGDGYAIAAVDEASFTSKDGDMGLSATVSVAGSSFAELFAGALALGQQAVVQRVDDGVCQLALVDTAPTGSLYTITITDWHLLHLDGEPIESVERLQPPNVIEVEQILGGEDSKAKGEAVKVTAIDAVQVSFSGQSAESYKIPADSRNALVGFVSARAASMFGADQDSQAVTLAVVPWVAAQPGDLVWLECTHPLLWDYATGTAGFSGKARVTGRAQTLLTGAVELTLLLEGRTDGRSLSPAAEVSAWAGLASAPTTIDVAREYYTHFAQTLALDGAFQVLHYFPADTEGTGQRYTISAVTDTGTVCRLTVSAQTGAFSLSTAKRSTLTLPASGAAYITDYQAGFAHTGDGSRWM